jgi:shikimate kinase
MSFKQYNQLTEGINDKFPLKALFIIGVAASGKSTISTPLKFYARHIDVDYPQEYYSEKYDIDLGRDGSAEGKNAIRKLGKRITLEELTNYVDGMLPMVINVVGDDLERTKSRIKILRDFGYDVGMIYINADIEKALKRVLSRRYGKNKDRHRNISPERVYDSYKKLITNVKQYQDLLYDRAHTNQELLDFFIQIQNNGFIGDETITKIHKEAAKFLGAPVRNEKGQKILAKLKSEKKKVLSDIVDRKEIQEKVARWF